MKTWILDTDITCIGNTYPLCPEIPDPYSPYIKHYYSVHVYVWEVPQEFYSFLFKTDFESRASWSIHPSFPLRKWILSQLPHDKGRATWSPVDGTSRPGDCLPQLIAQGRTRPGELNAKYHLYMNWLTKEVQGVFHYHYPSRTKSSWIMLHLCKKKRYVSHITYIMPSFTKPANSCPLKRCFETNPTKYDRRTNSCASWHCQDTCRYTTGYYVSFNLQIYFSSHTNCGPITSMKYHEITSHFGRNSWTKSLHLQLWLSGFFIHRSPGDKKKTVPQNTSKYWMTKNMRIKINH